MSDFTFTIHRGKISGALVLLLLVLNVGFSYSQNNIQLQLIEKSDKPKTEVEHFYTFEIKNTTNATTEVLLRAENINCDKARSSQSSLVGEILDLSKKAINKVMLSPGKSTTFLLRTNRDENTKLNSWSCIEVIAETATLSTKPVSVVIEQSIPDPKSFE